MSEFWEEEVKDDRQQMRKQILRWSLLFLVLCGGVFFAIWWASAAVNFSSSRVQATTGPHYRVTGVVRDAATGSVIPWAEIADAPSGRPPFFRATADRFGGYELLTIAEPHTVFVTALGYRPSSVRVGKAWYAWMPKGSEKLDIKLQAER